MKALIWKEWREQRIFLLMAIGFLLCITFINVVYLNIPSQATAEHLRRLDNINYSNLFLGWVILPLFFAFILGAAPFVKEFSNNTQDFLLNRPISTAKIFWLKFFFGIFLLLFIIQLCHWVLYVPDSSFKMQISAPDFKSPTPLVMFYLLSILIYFAVLFSSLLLKRELPAIIFSPFAVGMGILCIVPIYLFLLIILSPEQLQFIFSSVEDDIMLYYLPVSILLAGFLFFSFLVWQKEITKGVKSYKVFLTATGTIFLVYFVTHTILNISTGLELSKAIKQAKANGIELIWEEIIPPPVPKEKNAAIIYQKAFDLFDELNTKYKDKWEYLPWNDSPNVEGVDHYYNKGNLEELSLEQKKTFSQLLFEDTDFIKLYLLIEKAVNFPVCRFDVKYEDGPAMLLPHLQKMRQLARFVAFRTYLLTEEKRYEEAFNSACVGLKLEESLKDEPIIVSQLLRVTLNGIASGSLYPIIKTSSEEISIKDYQDLIAEIDKKENKLTKGLEADLAFVNTFVLKKILKGDVEELDWIWGGQKGSVSEKLSLIFYSYLGRPLLKQDCALYMRHLTESISLSRLPYYQAKERLLEWDRKLEIASKYKYPISAMFIPALYRFHLSQAKDNAQLWGLKIACALNIYKKQRGYYPENLTSLVPSIIPELPLDPFTGENFIYRKEDNGFIVYSIGPNEKDNNGLYDLKRTPRPIGKEEDDITWKYQE